jgi:plasmid maintenance system antidote protein VapI
MLKPFNLFDTIKNDFGIKNDAALARQLGVAPPQVSKVRGGILPCTDSMILRIHEVYGLPVAKIRARLSESAQAEAAGAV